MQFTTQIKGIPCICEVTRHFPYRPMRVYGSGMGDCTEPEYEYIEFDILDRKGYRARWLEAKMTKEDHQRMLEEFHLETTGQRYGYL